jgi:hypothetical protein
MCIALKTNVFTDNLARGRWIRRQVTTIRWKFSGTTLELNYSSATIWFVKLFLNNNLEGTSKKVIGHMVEVELLSI